MPRVPYTAEPGSNVTPRVGQIDPTTLAMAAGMMYSEGKLFEPQEQGHQAEGDPDLSYAKPKDDWNRIMDYKGQLVDPDKLSPKHLKDLKTKGVKVD